MKMKRAKLRKKEKMCKRQKRKINHFRMLVASKHMLNYVFIVDTMDKTINLKIFQ